MCHQRRNVSTAAKSWLEVCRRNISFQIYVSVESADGKKLASYLSLYESDNDFCAIQLDADAYANKISRERFVEFDAVARNQRTCRTYHILLVISRVETRDTLRFILHVTSREDKIVYST